MAFHHKYLNNIYLHVADKVKQKIIIHVIILISKFTKNQKNPFFY